MNIVPFRIESAALTHTGCVRDKNQDSFSIRERDGLWAVADGMGGHEGGEWASGKLVEKIGEIEVPDGLDEAAAAVEQAIRDANAAILEEAGRRGRQMGTTLVAMVVKGSRYRIFWVGDSRAYRLRDGEFTQLSRDHTQVQEMVDRGLMAPDHAGRPPDGPHPLARRRRRANRGPDRPPSTGEVVPGRRLTCSAATASTAMSTRRTRSARRLGSRLARAGARTSWSS
jgi:hypothetical protein